MKHSLWVIALVSSLSSGCARSLAVAPGAAFVHPEFPYAVVYDDDKKKSVLGDEWLLENYRYADRQPGTPANTDPGLERKKGYEETYEFDFNDDDKMDAKAQLPYPDLVFVNKRTNARLEVTTLLLDKRVADKELRILLTNIVENNAGTRSLFVGFDAGTKAVSKRMAARLLESGPAALGKQTGLVATVERADLDQVELDPKARWRRSRLLLLHAPFDYYAAETVTTPTLSKAYHKYRVLMLVEYTNSPDDFEAQYPDLLRLLNKIHLLTDDMLLDYLVEPLQPCSSAGQGKLTVVIDEHGVPSVSGAEGFQFWCASDVLKQFRFAATSHIRTVERAYDYSKPLRPAWLTRGSYVEQRKPLTEKPRDAAQEAPAEDAKPAEMPPAATDATSPGASATPPSPTTTEAPPTPSASGAPPTTTTPPATPTP